MKNMVIAGAAFAFAGCAVTPPDPNAKFDVHYTCINKNAKYDGGVRHVTVNSAYKTLLVFNPETRNVKIKQNYENISETNIISNAWILSMWNPREATLNNRTFGDNYTCINRY
jgi:hypothetical protein